MLVYIMCDYCNVLCHYLKLSFLYLFIVFIVCIMIYYNPERVSALLFSCVFAEDLEETAALHKWSSLELLPPDGDTQSTVSHAGNEGNKKKPLPCWTPLHIHLILLFILYGRNFVNTPTFTTETYYS